MRVLFVDDEALIVLLASSWLEDLGCEVETAFNATQALAKLKSEPRFDVLVTDVNMPGMSGYELAKRATDIRPGLKVILLSAANADPHGLPLIRKPFFQDDLKRVITATPEVR
jgi:CheY-like chemotaxis protein